MNTCSPFEAEQDEMSVNQSCRDFTPKLLDIPVAVLLLKHIGNINRSIGYHLTENIIFMKEHVLSEIILKVIRKINEKVITIVYNSIRLLKMETKEIMKSRWIVMIVEKLL